MNFKPILASVIALGMLPAPLSALSCAPPNILRDFNDRADSDKIYRLAIGSYTAKEAFKGKGDYPEEWGNGTFTGRFMGRNGFTQETTVPLSVRNACFGDFCSALPSDGREFFAFLEKSGNGFQLVTAPCGGDTHTVPDSRIQNELRKCMRNGRCTEAQIKRLDPNY